MTEFIHLSLKTSEQVEWSEPLSGFLTSTFGRSFAAELEASINQFNKLRVPIENSKITDNSLIPKYLKYYSNLVSLDMRVPLSAVIAFSKQKEDSLGLQFTWTDVFDDLKEHTSKSASFEKACTLFNVAVLNSYFGATYATQFDWKSAIDYFAKSAGILDHIASKFHHAPTIDLKVDTLKGLSKLMLSQALEGFLWNYLQSQANIKHSLVARLAEGTSLTLRSCVEYLSNIESENLKFKEDLSIKSDYLHAFALVHYADSYTESDKIGHALASLKLAKEAISFAKRGVGAHGLSDEMLSRLLKELETEIKEKETTWDKDNDLIYHQTVPDGKNIPLIKPLEGVKVISFESQLKSIDVDDLFEKIVPMEALAGLSIYSERQADIYRKWSENVEVANEQIISTFEFLNLPNSVREVQALIRPITEEDREKEDDYPRVLAMAHDVENGKSNGVNFKLGVQNITTTRSQIFGQIEKANSLFERSKHISMVKGAPLVSELQRLKDEVSKIEKILSDAGSSDNKLQTMWNEYDRDISILSNGTGSVQKWLDDSEEVPKLTQQINLLDLDIGTDNENNEIKQAQNLINTVSEYKGSLDLLIKERITTLSDLKTKMHSEDISTLLLQNKGSSQKEMNALFEKELAKYEIYTTRLARLIEAQEEIVLDLKTHLGQLLGLAIIRKKVDKRNQEKGTVKAKMASLIRAYDTWKVCTKGIKEAGAFYTSLATKVIALVGRVETLVNEQESGFSYDNSGPYSTPSVYNPQLYSQLSSNQKF